MKLGRLGVWYSADKCNATQVGELVRAVERNGYSAYWYPEGRGHESMALASHLLSKSEKLMVGSSIANIYARDPYSARQGMLFLNEFYGDRFILGLGASGPQVVEGLHGVPFAKHWYHSEHLLVDGKKMSKSLGNLYTLDDLKAHRVPECLEDEIEALIVLLAARCRHRRPPRVSLTVPAWRAICQAPVKNREPRTENHAEMSVVLGSWFSVLGC